MVHEFTRCGWPVPPRQSCRGTPPYPVLGGGKEGKREVFTSGNPSNTPIALKPLKPQIPITPKTLHRLLSVRPALQPRMETSIEELRPRSRIAF